MKIIKNIKLPDGETYEIGGGSSLPIGSTIVLDKALSYKESQGLALQGTYVYKTAVAGERYGYPDFYAKCLEEYENATEKAYLKSNVTYVGSVADNQGVLSGFSTSNCAKVTEVIPTSTNIEIIYKVTPTSFSQSHNVIMRPYKANYAFGFNTTGVPQLYTGAWTNGKTTYKVNQTVWFKVIWNGSSNILYSMLDNNYTIDTLPNNWITEVSWNTTTNIWSGDGFNIGQNDTATSEYLIGSIDLNNSYINVDGSRWWSGTTTVVKNPNGHKFYPISQKSYVDSIYESTGIAEYYGIDLVNERIFLPRNNKFWQFTTNTGEVNNYVEAGLPNITGNFNIDANRDEYFDPASGCFTVESGGSDGCTGDDNTSTKVFFNASKSNPIYGKSNTVQPASSKKLLYYVVGNTVSDTSWVDVVTQVEGGVKDLEDKTQEGIERLKASSNALTTTQITNCITEIPQDIKLELNDGVLTLKAGSKVYMPNGFEADGTTPKFDEVVIESDKPWNYGTGEFLILVNSNGVIHGSKIEHVYSGTTEPTIVAGVVWYDTTNNIIKRSQTGTDWDEKNYALPISVVRTSSGSVTAIDQTFNGFGYIGSTVFVTKGVKGLIPNGRNEDGTLNNIEYITDKVFTKTMPTANDNIYIGVFLDRNGIGTFPDKLLNPNWSIENYITNTSGETSTVLFFATATTTAGVISNFTPKLPFRAVDYSDYANGVGSTKAYITETYINGTSWYRVYSDGWCEQGGRASASEQNVFIRLLKDYKDTNYSPIAISNTSGSAANYNSRVHTLTTSSFMFNSLINKACTCFWEAKGYIR